MSDVKDILGLGRDGDGSAAGGPNPKKEKTKELLKERPKGMSRETFNLLHGSHHIQQGIVLDDLVKKDEPKAAPAYAQARPASCTTHCPAPATMRPSGCASPDYRAPIARESQRCR